MDSLYDTYNGPALAFGNQSKRRKKIGTEKTRELIVPTYGPTANRLIVTHNYRNEAVVVLDRHSNNTSGSFSTLSAPSVSSIGTNPYPE